jgi:ribose transport system permease protein
VVIDVRWFKNRHKLLSSVYVSPDLSRASPCRSPPPRTVAPYALNDKLRAVETIGLGEVEAPEDVIARRGRQPLLRQPPRRHHPLLRARLPPAGGLCPYRRPSAGSGLRRRRARSSPASAAWVSTASRPIASVHKADRRDQPFAAIVIDDSRLRLADDLDIAPDGRIFFSEATDAL